MLKISGRFLSRTFRNYFVITMFCSYTMFLSPSFCQMLIAKEFIKLKQITTFHGFYKGYFSPSGTKLAVLNENQIILVELPTGKELTKIDIPSDQNLSLLSMSFSPNGKILAVNYYLANCAKENTGNMWKCELTQVIALYNSLDGKWIKTLWTGKKENFGRYLSFSNDGQYLATMTDVPRTWDIESGIEVFQAIIPKGNRKINTMMSPDKKWLASYTESFKPPITSGAFYITNLDTKEQFEINSDQICDFKFSDDSTFLITTSNVFDEHGLGTGTAAKVYEVGKWKLLKKIDSTDASQTFDISSDNQFLVGGGKEKFKIFSLQTGKLLVEEFHHKRNWKEDSELPSFLTHIEFSPDGKMLVTGGEDGVVKLWEIERK